MRHHLPVLAFLSTLPGALGAQTLDQRIQAVGAGNVHLSFVARPGVCGTRNGINIQNESDEWESDCAAQPVRVALRVADKRVVKVRTYVGGRWRGGTQATDLGTIRPQEAAAYFIRLAKQEPGLEDDPLLPAVLADSVTIWPDLLELARTTRLYPNTRRTAVFWLGQAATSAVVPILDSIAGNDGDDREVRKHAVFALSQRSDNEGVPALIRIARTSTDPELRRTALFWLGQSEDPRAVDLFEEILK